MEGVTKYWEEAESEAEVEEVGLLKRQAHMHICTITTTANIATEHTNVFSGLNDGGLEFSQTQVDSGDIEKKITSPPSGPVTSVDSTSPNNVINESERVGVITENMQLVQELYLERVYQKPPTQGFYCPKCKVCIQKVLILDTVREEPSVPAQPSPLPDTPRCSSCFSCLIPPDEQDRGGSRTKPSLWEVIGRVIASASPNAILRKLKGDTSKILDQPQPDDVIVNGGSPELPTSAVQDPTRSSKTWEILKSIVYGGMIESIASLSIVTSAASADATTLNILALSLANLIGGLFILVHNLWDLKSEQPRANNQTSALVDRYYQVLGQKENFFLHVSIAILSFLIFGLVPPLVYGFTFYESNNKDLKLAAVAGAFLLCITLLSIAKTYIQRANKYQTYFKTVLYYISTGAMASIVSYLVGELIRKLLEKLGWFDSKNSSFTMLLPEMSIEKPRFGSY